MYNQIEKKIKLHSQVGLKHLLKYMAIEVRVSKLQKDVYSDVYGSQAGGPFSDSEEVINALITGDEFSVEDAYSAGNLMEGYMYVSERDFNKVSAGDVIQIVRDDDVSIRFKVEAEDSVGLTTKVFRRMKLLSLGD